MTHILTQRPLDAHDIRAQFGQKMRGIGASDPPADVEDADALQY